MNIYKINESTTLPLESKEASPYLLKIIHSSERNPGEMKAA